MLPSLTPETIMRILPSLPVTLDRFVVNIRFSGVTTVRNDFFGRKTSDSTGASR